MNTLSKIKFGGCALILSLFMAACVDHMPDVENLPRKDIAFTYSVIDDEYQLDYYVGSKIKFVNTSAKEGECTWNFGDGTEPQTGNEIIYTYDVTGTYKVRLTVAGAGLLEQAIYISDIQPIVTLIQEDSICEVRKSFVSFDVKLPNPKELDEKYVWIFPEGTRNEAGELIERFEGKDPGKIMFGNIGSQTPRLQVTLGGRALDEYRKNVQVGSDVPAPTLYYAVKGGNIMALKLLADKPEDMDIFPFNMSVSSGQTPMNILFKDQNLYVLDPGRQFTYVDDADQNMGDGSIFVMSKDGSAVQTMLTSSAWAFSDPFYGCIDGASLYYADRNQGIRKLNLTDRNLLFSATENAFAFFVENARLAYYGKGLSYGAINACFGKVNGVWYWCKTFNGVGIFRFVDADISTVAIKGDEGIPTPAAGVALAGTMVKSFVWDEANGKFYFTVFDLGYEGFYGCTLAELDEIQTRGDLAKYKKTLADGKTVTPITEPGKGEGSSGEFMGICQLTLNKEDGSVYFGLRSADAAVKSGLMRYNPATDKIEHVIEGVSVLGVAVNPELTKLF